MGSASGKIAGRTQEIIERAVLTQPIYETELRTYIFEDRALHSDPHARLRDKLTADFVAADGKFASMFHESITHYQAREGIKGMSVADLDAAIRKGVDDQVGRFYAEIQKAERAGNEEKERQIQKELKDSWDATEFTGC